MLSDPAFIKALWFSNTRVARRPNFDERYIERRQFRASVRYPHQRKGYFKSNSIVDKNLIDTLYSESVVLHN